MLRDREPGEHGNDPYSDVDISNLPDWWKKGIEIHREYGLRPYIPPRFEDDVAKYEVIEQIEEKYEIEIQFRSLDANEDNEWLILVDGEVVGSVTRFRDPGGYSVFEISSENFKSLIEEAVS